MSFYSRTIDLQKLSQAWDRVKKNKPAAGIDNVTYDIFDARKREELKQLQIELSQHSYEALPVRRVVLYKEEKARTIALYAMRDKVVQQSLAFELNRMYDAMFADSTYAYRSNKSALVALDKLEEKIQNEKYEYALKVDIHHFFDSIRWEELEVLLRKRIMEDDVIDLIRQNSTTRILEDGGEIAELRCGIHQGSGIAPILSNIYLMDFDRWLEKEADIFFIRYSDDMFVLGHEKERLLDILMQIKLRFSGLGLEVNEKKSICTSLDQGVEFLGHSFNEKGKSIPKKAVQDLQERLEAMWLTSNMDFMEKVKKATAIIDGWEQYFREDRDIESILEFVAIIASAENQEEYLKTLSEKRRSIINIYKDITEYLAGIWRARGYHEMELFEYEQFWQVPAYANASIEENVLSELLGYYRKLLIRETEEDITEIMQIYTDLKLYGRAEFWMDKKEQLEKKDTSANRSLMIYAEQGETSSFIMNKSTANRILKIFAGREDIYSLETLGNGGKRHIETQMLPLTEAIISDHLEGKITVGTYIQRPNNTVKNIVLDVDVSKRILFQYDRTTPEFEAYLERALEKANAIVKLYRNLGIEGYIEYSGCRGYHVWLIFSEWIPLRYANMFCELIESKLERDDDITIEYFPNKTRVRDGKYGQCLKLPYGRHGRTGELAYFIDEEGNKIIDVNGFLDGIAKYQLSIIKKILAANTGYKENAVVQDIILDENMLAQTSSSVRTVLLNCNLMKYLCQKAYKTGYLSHFERLSLLYVFGHLGDEGKEFIHKIMSQTLNYQYQTTAKFISRIPQKPISCLKLREQYKSITAEYGCNCSFKRSKNCYPSPVLHAIALSNNTEDSITVPTSRTLTKEKEKKVIEELNIHKKAEELAQKILDLKKQRRRLDSSIGKIENELSKIYDDEGIDCLEIEMGLLCRRKQPDGRYEWLIEI